MGPAKRLAVLGLAAMCMYMLYGTGVFPRLARAASERLEAERMKNVTVSVPDAESSATGQSRSAQPESPAAETGAEEAPAGQEAPAEAAQAPTEAAQAASEMAEAADHGADLAAVQPVAAFLDIAGREDILPTTIEGGLTIKNETRYTVDAAQLLSAGPRLTLPADAPQILIIHTHGSEAYTQAGLDRYESNDANRTADTDYNIIRVGDELAKLLEEAGLKVLHDREIYDYPSYTGSYTRSGAATERYLSEYPSIAMVIDLHRDALGTTDVIYKTMAEEEGVCASQVMLLVGTDDSGLEHPNWRSNLALALYLQQAVDVKHPTLMRPVSLVRERYNQHLTGGSMIIEVGSSGNTLQEALAAIRLFADAAGPALAALVEPAEGAADETV